MRITVIGCGRWGSFICWYLDRVGHDVTLYGRGASDRFRQISETRSNGTVTFSNKVKFSFDLQESLAGAQIVIIAVNSQGLRPLMNQMAHYELSGKTVVLCMKGLEIGTGKRLTQVADEFLPPDAHSAIWVGPGHVQEFIKGIPNCMVIDSKNTDITRFLIREFSGGLIRFYYGQDLIGNEIGAASKNVVGIAAGMLDGLNLSSLKGSLMSRGTREISRLIKAMGGNALSAYGLCHLGDYEATLFSPYSHNRLFGEKLVKGESYDELAEGYYTSKAMMLLADEYDTELPICSAVYDVLYNNVAPGKAISTLFLRTQKGELYDI